MQTRFFEFFENFISLIYFFHEFRIKQISDVPLMRLFLLGAGLSITTMTF